MTKKEKKKIKKMARKRHKEELKAMHKNRHHVIPSSRLGSDAEENIAYVDVLAHEKYHHLFSNKIPDEIIKYLVNYFWRGNWGFVFEAIAKHLEEEEV